MRPTKYCRGAPDDTCGSMKLTVVSPVPSQNLKVHVGKPAAASIGSIAISHYECRRCHDPPSRLTHPCTVSVPPIRPCLLHYFCRQYYYLPSLTWAEFRGASWGGRGRSPPTKPGKGREVGGA